MSAALRRLLLLAALLLFLFFGDVPERSRFWSAFFDAGHTALFGVSALLIHGLLVGAGSRRALLPAFVLTLVLGAATELVQVVQRRGDPSVTDLLRDTAGAAAFLLILWATKGSGARARRLLAVAAAVVILFMAGWTLLSTSAAYIARNRAFPTLFALDGSWWEGRFIELRHNTLTPGRRPAFGLPSGIGPLARLDLRPGRYSGISFREVYPDWRDRRQLVLTIASDLASPLPIAIRIHDAAHDQRYRDRFNRRLLVQPGVNRFVIPLDEVRHAPDRREMEMRRVRGIVLFASGLTRRTHIYLGPLILE